MLVSIYPSFYAINRINQKNDHEILYLTSYYMYELSHVNEYCSIICFKGALSQNYFQLVHMEKTWSFPLRLKTRMSCSTGATQSLKTKPCRYGHLILSSSCVPHLLPLTFWKWL